MIIFFRRDGNNNQLTSETISQNLLTKAFGDNTMSFDIKYILDKNSQQFWNDVKIKFISKEKQDALQMLEDIISKYSL